MVIMVDKIKAVELIKAGATYRDVATMQGVTPQAIHKAIKPLLPSQATTNYKDKRADILAEMQRKILTTVDSKLIKQSSLMQRLSSFGILYDKERIERGLSDNNTRPLVMIQINQDGVKTSVTSEVKPIEGEAIDVES